MTKKYSNTRRTIKRVSKDQVSTVKKQTFLIISATVVLIGLIIFVGIPSLIRLAIFLADVRSDNFPIGTQDTIPPAVPQLSIPPVATTSAKIKLTGYAESGTTILLFHQNRQTDQSIATADGTFEFSSIDLDQGNNVFSVKATDKTGNQSPISSTVSVIFDSTPPDLQLTQPEEGQQLYGNSQKRLQIIGSTELNAQITVNDRLIVTAVDGSFSTSLELSEGTNQLTIASIDQAGNSTTIERTVTYHP